MVAVTAAVRPHDAERRCAVCGRLNDPDRSLCATCAADLDTGRALEVVPARRRPAATGLLARLSHGSQQRERALLVAAGLLIALTVVLVPLWIFDLGPFAPSERLDRAIFLSSAYEGPPAMLAVDSVATTTVRGGVPDRSISPLNLFDGDPSSTWIGAPISTDGSGEVIQLLLEEPAWVTRLEIRNGDHQSEADYGNNGRILTAILSFDGDRDYRIDLLDIGLQPQVVQLPAPELTTQVTIRVVRTFDVGTPQGVALSEVTIVGWSASTADAALARQRAIG
jgi:predicted nucleic acid-binding Zn ribbon protein